jgi:hypothetical protein
MAKKLWKVTVREVHKQEIYVFAEDHEEAIQRVNDDNIETHGLSEYCYSLPEETWKAEPLENRTYDDILRDGMKILASYRGN